MRTDEFASMIGGCDCHICDAHVEHIIDELGDTDVGDIPSISIERAVGHRVGILELALLLIQCDYSGL